MGTCVTYDTINVTVHPTQSTNLPNIYLCQGDSALIFGSYENIAATYYDTLNTIHGCDSIISQQLVVDTIINNNLGTYTICDGDSIQIFGIYQSIAGVYTDTLQSAAGCDSIVTTTLIVDPIHAFSLGNDTAFCAGDSLILDAGAGATSYQWNNGTSSNFTQQTLTVTQTGTYFVAATLGTCVTYDTINVTVHPTQSTNLPNIYLCQGDSALIFGSYENIAATYYDTLNTIHGCDSIISQQLVVDTIINNNLGTYTICDGDSIQIFGIYQSLAGVYTDTLQAISGCDSVVSRTLTVNPTPNVNLGGIDTICRGDSILLDAGPGGTSYRWMNGSSSAYHNQTFSVNDSGFYFVQVTIGSCSASDTVEIKVIEPVYTQLPDIEICDGDSIIVFGNYVSTAGVYEDTLASFLTCDSILLQEIIVNPKDLTTDSVEICNGDSLFVGGAYQTADGVYYDTLQNINSCDSVIVTVLQIKDSLLTQVKDSICWGDSILIGGSYESTPGIYYETLVSAFGCDSIIEVDLYVAPKINLTLSANPNKIKANRTRSSQLNAIGNGTISWSPGDFLSCTNCPNPLANPEETTLYTARIDSSGCIRTDTITIIVDDNLFIPEGFSPNGDGVNDLFEIIGIDNYPDNKIIIFNRWGDKVYEASPYKGDWDGVSRTGISTNNKLPAGTYFYILDLGKNSREGQRVYKGTVYIND